MARRVLLEYQSPSAILGGSRSPASRHSLARWHLPRSGRKLPTGRTDRGARTTLKQPLLRASKLRYIVAASFAWDSLFISRIITIIGVRLLVAPSSPPRHPATAAPTPPARPLCTDTNEDRFGSALALNFDLPCARVRRHQACTLDSATLWQARQRRRAPPAAALLLRLRSCWTSAAPRRR